MKAAAETVCARIAAAMAPKRIDHGKILELNGPRQRHQRYLAQHTEAKKKPPSVRNDRFLLRCHLLPALGKLALKDITRSDITTLHHSLWKTPYVANRALALLSKLLSLAILWGALPEGANPWRGVEKYREHKRQRFLSGEELARLGKVLREVERIARISWSG